MYQVVFLSSKVHLVFKVVLAITVMSNVLFASKVFLVSKGLAEMVSVFWDGEMLALVGTEDLDREHIIKGRDQNFLLDPYWDFFWDQNF